METAVFYGATPFKGLGFRVEDSGLRAYGLGLRIQGLGFWV